MSFAGDFAENDPIIKELIQLEDEEREQLITSGWIDDDGIENTFAFYEKGDMKWMGEIKGQTTQAFRRPSPHNNLPSNLITNLKAKVNLIFLIFFSIVVYILSFFFLKLDEKKNTGEQSAK
mgnify:CR=1 FL=1